LKIEGILIYLVWKLSVGMNHAGSFEPLAMSNGLFENLQRGSGAA